MNRWFLLVLFLLVLLAPLAISWRLGQVRQVAHGGDELVIMTSHQEGIRREFAEAFGKWHQREYGTAVAIDYRTFGGSDIKKYFEERIRGRKNANESFDIDLVWGGGDYLHDVQLKKLGCLQPFKLDSALMH